MKNKNIEGKTSCSLMYQKSKESRKRYNKKNADKIKEYMKHYSANNNDRIRNASYKSKFGMTLDDYNVMLIEQDYSCLICNIHESQLDRKLAVDHCHDTGNIRGLLCNNCNTGLGRFRDDINLLTKAIEYLQQHRDR